MKEECRGKVNSVTKSKNLKFDAKNIRVSVTTVTIFDANLGQQI